MFDKVNVDVNPEQLENDLDPIDSTLDGIINDPEKLEHDENELVPIIWRLFDNFKLSKLQHPLNELFSISRTESGIFNGPVKLLQNKNEFEQIRFNLFDNVNVPSKPVL